MPKDCFSIVAAVNQHLGFVRRSISPSLYCYELTVHASHLSLDVAKGSASPLEIHIHACTHTHTQHTAHAHAHAHAHTYLGLFLPGKMSDRFGGEMAGNSSVGSASLRNWFISAVLSAAPVAQEGMTLRGASYKGVSACVSMGEV